MNGFKLYDVSLVVKTDLDDVIERLKYDREIDMDINELAPQIAEWLEELKVLREAVQCNAFTDGYKKGSMSMLKEVNRKIDELENSCKEEYGCEIMEMYVEVVLELKEWIKHLN